MKHILSEEFLREYRDMQAPFSPIGEFVYLRTYSRYLEDLGRRESWFETARRTTEYNISLGIRHQEQQGNEINVEEVRKEAELLFDNLYHLRTFTSGRTLYMGGTKVVKDYPLSNYNCAFIDLDQLHNLVDVFYLLMVGSGVGVRIDNKTLNQFPRVRHLSMESIYDPTVRGGLKKEAMEYTTIRKESEDTIRIQIGDSKEGWCAGLTAYFDLLLMEEYEDITSVIIDYSFVRPEGERLKRFGGRASGHKSLQRMFEKINRVINRREDHKIQSIDLLDMATIISENVVSGGVRRSAMMVICNEDDEDVINAKRDIYQVIDGNWIENPEISHRKMSNNSVLYTERPELSRIKEILESIRINGEPGFINGTEANRRKSTFRGCNPCGEILLRSKQCCNLTTNNLLAFANGNQLEVDKLKEIIKLSTRVAIRMTLVEVELPDWNEVMHEDRIIGISLTGMMDMMNQVGMDYDQLESLLTELRAEVRKEGERYCEELGIKAPELMTTIKPEGSLSTLPGVSSGIHFAHSDYYIRRVRISVSDPLYKLMELQGSYPIHNEVGQTDENCTVKVIEFPMKAPEGRTKYQVGAIEQLELYKMSMKSWSDHNTSITVHVRDHEWEAVAKWVYDNFDYVVGITFLPLMEETYPLLPYECTTKEDYERRMASTKPIDYQLLSSLDREEEWEILDNECSTGACPIR